MAGSVFYITSCLILIAVLFCFPRTKKRAGAIGRLVICIVFYECWAAFVSGLFSLAHIPVSLLSVGIANIAAAALILTAASVISAATSVIPAATSVIPAAEPESTKGIPCKLRALWSERQRFTLDWFEITFAVLLALFLVFMFRERFGQEAAIIYGTIDPTDRFSRAVGILAEKTVIGPYPNMYFGHITNALFLGAAEPGFQGVYAIRAFEAKEVINVWIAGMLFFTALRQISDKPFAKAVFFVLGFAYALGYPWNNELWGFGYLGVSVTLIVLVQIGVRTLFDERQKPWIGLILISAGCFGVGITYTMFAPPVFIAAFAAILWWAKRDFIRIIKTEIFVFAIPVIMTLVFTVFIGRGEAGSDIGSQFVIEGAIHRNLFGDFLIWLPFALFAVIFAAAKRKPDFAWIFAIVFAVFQFYFLYQMFRGEVSTYYYYKLNFVTWFVVLFLAGTAIAVLTAGKSRRAMAMVLCCLLVFCGAAVFTVRGYDYVLSDKNPFMNPIFAADGLFGVYANNNAYFKEIGIDPIYYRWDFLELCSAAREERAAQTGAGASGDYYQNRVEIVTDNFQDAYWADALVGEHIEQQPVEGITQLPSSEAKIWIVLTNSELYRKNSAAIDACPKIFENDLGFVIRSDDL